MRIASFSIVGALAFACAFGANAAAQQPGASKLSVRGVVRGVVRDEAGAAVAGAQVSLLSAKTVLARARTDASGRFAFEDVRRADETRALVVEVSAQGFASIARELSAQGSNSAAQVGAQTDADAGELQFVLAPAAFDERVTVSATRTEARLDETAASVAVLSERDVETSGALRLDDVLRQTVGFQLFRRAGSRTANPTTQGVSLRGTGASGASRAVVLADGVPLNDPFGGWVYWDRVPRGEVARVEVLRGGASALYGGGALGGAVNISTRRPTANALALETSYGNERTPDATLYAAGVRGAWAASLGAEVFSTGGYVLVDEAVRGRVDTLAASRDSAVSLSLERSFARGGGRAFLRGNLFGESRTNGTPLQTNRTHARQLAAGLDFSLAQLGALTARVYGGTQVFDQNFSAVASDRNSETLTRVQRSPSQFLGASLQWSRSFASRHTVVAGLDAREVRGSSDEIAYALGRATALVGAGGRERTVGVFAEDVARVGSRLVLTGGVRFDRWREYAAASTTRPLRQGAPAVVVPFTDRTESAVSPRGSVLYRLAPRVALTASAYRAFRQPTLNELYRGFRVGDVLTLANENLRAERLTGGEVGASVTPSARRLNLRGALFWTEIARPVSNVTLSVAPGLITRQRQNLGSTRARGLEVEAEARLNHRWTASGGYLFVDSTVEKFPANAALEGLRVPQVARQQLTFQVRYDDPSRWTASLQGRAAGAQFDDDQNLFRLAPYFTLDAYVSRCVSRAVELFAAAENLLDRRYDVGRTPIRTLSPPVLARVGVRVRVGAK
ncbi:MAG: TonB-dependent receptor [Pyrinomonadaceae bacterium]